ncbi:MAG: HAMP domain-containing histidine kinase [Candidatus Eremiobacteraeota bacterium]|nr:HAMP domain-containing histidine kinase [Candidatus Eremiobacteraeota bacterium]
MKLLAGRSLNERLVGIYVLSLLAALAVFSMLAVAIIDRTMRNSLDGRLESIARGSSIFIDVSHRRIQIDGDDRKQFLALLGVDVAGEILDNLGRVRLSTVTKPPAGISTLARNATSRFHSLGSAQEAVRAYAMPLRARGTRIGTIVVWRPDDWIEEFDRDAAVAFLLGALAIATLSWFVGNGLTRRVLDDAFSRQRRFTADASHELRAPLAVIRAEADLALRKGRPESEYRTFLSTIAGEADRMEALVEDLLASARADSSSYERENMVAIDGIVARASSRLASLAAQRRVAIDLQADSSASVRGDPQALERAVLAVVHNAIKFAPEGSHVVIHTSRADGRARIVVSDAGPGFSPEGLAHATERFWRGADSRDAVGTGLGLAIAESITHAARGTMAIENGQAGGGVVRFSFTVA